MKIFYRIVKIIYRLLFAVKSGSNSITRKSADSSLTVPFDQTFRSLDSIDLSSTSSAENFVFCGCGWPQHMLLPKGTPEGLLCELFVMITDNQQDRVCIF